MSSLTAQPAAKTMTARQTGLPPAAPASPEGAPGCLRPFANERLNSRLPRALPSGKWSPAWSAAIDGALMPTAVLASGPHALVLGRTAFQLFVQGKPVAHGERMGEDAEILPVEGVFLQPDRYSRIATYSLGAGSPEKYFTANGANDTLRTFIHRRAGNTIVASADESRSPSDPTPNRTVYLQVFNAAGEQTANRDADTGRLRLAMHNDFIITARPNAIDFLDLALNAPRRIEAQMTPQGLSLDESGRVYLLCEINRRQRLWIVSPTGEYAAVPMPDGVVAFHRPPVVGYDHRVYLLSLNRIVTVNDAGQLDWQFNAPARVAGATVLTEGHLIAATGDTIIALNPKGESQILCQVPGEQLMASPILGSAGELYALTDRRLHCFTAA
ncbi:MAG: hypothetical protein ACKV2U_17260 [Bryobacteraceae bacterium]